MGTSFINLVIDENHTERVVDYINGEDNKVLNK